MERKHGQAGAPNARRGGLAGGRAMTRYEQQRQLRRPDRPPGSDIPDWIKAGVRAVTTRALLVKGSSECTRRTTG
jgi:hypothetical protein